MSTIDELLLISDAIGYLLPTVGWVIGFRADIATGTAFKQQGDAATHGLGPTFDAGPVTLDGRVELVDADRPATEVRVRIERNDIDFGGYWNGESWVDEANTWLDADLVDGRWDYTVDLGPGSYQVHAFAADDEAVQTWDHGREMIEVYVR